MDKNLVINAPDFGNLVKYAVYKYGLQAQVKSLGLDIQDLVQEVRHFIFMRRAPKTEISHTTYICKATYFYIREQLCDGKKKAKRKKHQAKIYPLNFDIKEKPQEDYHTSQQKAYKILEEAPLTDRERNYLFQIYVKGLSQRTVSKTANCTSANISLIVRHSLDKIRKFYDVQG